MSRMVYFVAGGGKTKVGVSVDVTERVKAIQAACPVPLRITHTAEGNIGLERAIHKVLEDRRAHGEWFEGEVEREEAIAIIGQALNVAGVKATRWKETKAAPSRGLPTPIADQHARSLLPWLAEQSADMARAHVERLRLAPDWGSISRLVQNELLTAVGLDPS